MNVSKFYKVSIWDIIQVRWKMFTWFGGKFIQEIIYQISSKLPFTQKKHFGLFFSRQSVGVVWIFTTAALHCLYESTRIHDDILSRTEKEVRCIL